MAPSIADYAEARLLDSIFSHTPFCVSSDPFVSLHTGAPAESSASDGTEIIAGANAYLRKQVSWTKSSATGGTLDNSKHAYWTNMPACTLTHVGIWDSAGNQLWSGALTTSKVVNAGDSFEIATGDLDVTLS